MRFSALFVVAAAVISGYTQTVGDVLNDIANISDQVTALDNSITAFPSSGGTLAGALAIHNAAGTLKTSIDDATGDDTPGPVSDADGQTILDAVTAFEPTIEHALVGIVDKKPAFDALPLGGVSALVKQDLADLRTSTYAFATALIDAAPSGLQADATALRKKIDDAFAVAQGAYA